MNYKKAYEDVLKRVELLRGYSIEGNDAIDKLFPELHNDKRIIKRIISFIKQSLHSGGGVIVSKDEEESMLAWLENQKCDTEEHTDFTIYHPLKNGKGEYECIPYSFYGSLTSFSEDKDLIDFLRTCFYTKEECNEWIEQQKEQKSTEYLDKNMIYVIINKLHDLSFSPDILINSKEYKQINEITNDVRNLLDYPIEHKSAEYIKRNSKEWNALLAEQYDKGFWKGKAEIDEYKIIKKHITEDFLSNEVYKQLRKCGWYVTDEKPVAWSEEDNVQLNAAIQIVSNSGHSTTANWLKSLRPVKQKWSKEDEIRLKEALEVLDESLKYLPIGYGFNKDVMYVKDWLKSLRRSCKSSEEPEYYQHFDPDC